MAGSARGLGRGLDALLGGFSEDRIAPEVMLLPLDSIRANPDQPRREFSEEALEDLTRSIKDQGVLQPVLVRPLRDVDGFDFEIVAGERRWRASRLAGLTEIPALVREVDDEQSLALALIENLQREDLNPIEQANGLRQLVERFGLKQDDLAGRVGKSRSAVANTLRLLQLPEDVQKEIGSGAVSAGHARALLSMNDDQARLELLARIKQDGLSVREAEDMAGHWKRRGEFPETLEPAAGPVDQAASPARKREKQPLAEELRAAQADLAQAFGVKVMVAGTAEKGKITFHFDAAEQLRDLLVRLGAAQS